MNQVKPLPLRKQQKNYTRQRLIEVARDLFIKQGIQDTGIDDIAKAAGTSRATVYTHFGGKTEIIRELVAELWETSQALCADFGALKEWSRPAVRAWVASVFARHDAFAESTRMVMREAPSAIMNDTHVRLRSYAEAITSNQALWVHFTHEEAQRRATILIIQLFRCMWNYQNGLWGTELEPLIDSLTDIWLASLQAPSKIGRGWRAA